MPRGSVLRIVSFAAASLALAIWAVSFVIDAIIEHDVRDEMAQALDALRKDVDQSFKFFVEYHSSLAVRGIRSPEEANREEFEELRAQYGFDMMRILRKDGSVVVSSGGGTNLFVRSAEFRDGMHTLEVGANFRNFTQRGLGEIMMAECCENWPRIIDGSLLCFRLTDGRVVSSSIELEKDGRGRLVTDVFPDFENYRSFPEGEYFHATAYGEECLCLMAGSTVFRFANIVPLTALAQYRFVPLMSVALVLIVLVSLFTLVALKLSTLTARLRSYIEGEKTRMRNDLDAARLVQTSALPPPFPRQYSYSIRARMDPAKVVGGDFYDYQILPTGHLYFLVADVAGKGISSAMFMMRAKSVIKQCLAETDDLAQGMTKANEMLVANNDSKLFVTVWVGILDPRTGYVRYVNAGHNPPIVRRAGGDGVKLEWVKCQPSLVMALMPGVEYSVNSFTLATGDVLFLYTDGVTEAQDMNGRFYGERRLEKVLSEPADDCIGRVRSDLDEFEGDAEPADDVTMVELDYAGTPPGAARGFPCNREVGFVESEKFLEEELVRADCSPAMRRKFLLAFDEVGSNVISYSGAPYFTVKVAVEATPPAITLTVTDTGKSFNPLDRDAPDLMMPFEKRVSGGFGIFITRQLMDEVIYCRDEGRNVLTLRKSCPDEPGSSSRMCTL